MSPPPRHSAARLNLPRSALGSLAAAGAVTLALAGTAARQLQHGCSEESR